MTANQGIIDVSESIGSLIRQGLIEEAQDQLSRYAHSPDRPWRRMYRHYQAKIKLIQGEFKKACQELQDIISEEGPHILLYADLVAGYFMAKQFTRWKIAIDDLDRAYQATHKFLQPINKWRAQIILAKSLELNGAIWEAYQIFQNLSKSSDIQFRIKGLTHLVRLESQYPLSDSFSRHYYLLKNFSLKNDQAEYDYDVLHSLLLCEAEHINITSAVRTLAIIPKEQICYFSLGYFELLDIWLRKDPLAYEKLTSTLGHCEPFSASDKKLLAIVENSDCLDWYTWLNELPIAQYFRLIRFLFKYLSEEDRVTCYSQAMLIVNGLSLQSRKIWTDFLYKDLNPYFANDEIELQWKNNNTLIVNSKEVPFGRQKLVCSLLQIFFETGGIVACENITLNLWNEKLDDFNYDRIRQLVKRINKVVKTHTQRDLFLNSGSNIELLNCYTLIHTN
jgi:hypothetical protein